VGHLPSELCAGPKAALSDEVGLAPKPPAIVVSTSMSPAVGVAMAYAFVADFNEIGALLRLQGYLSAKIPGI
jgi:hypothetical protein